MAREVWTAGAEPGWLAPTPVPKSVQYGLK